MEQQFKVLNGVVKLWCAGGGILSFYKDAPKMLRNRGDVIWYYGGPPSVTDSSAAITEFPLRAWLWGVNGYVHWLTVSPGEDPWFHFDGGQTALVYSGERFGLTEPIPSIRLKIQRNCLQDLAVLDSLKGRKSLDSLRAEAARSTTTRASMIGGILGPRWPTFPLTSGSEAPLTMRPGTPSRLFSTRLRPPRTRSINMRSVFKRRQMKILYLIVLSVSFTFATVGIPKLSPEASVPMQKELEDVARVGSVMVDGDVCQKIVTEQAKGFLFATDPRDRFLAGDNYDVDDVAFNTVKKILTRLSHLASFPADVICGCRSRGTPVRFSWSFAIERNEPILELGRALRRHGSADGDGVEDGTTGHGYKQARLDFCSCSSL